MRILHVLAQLPAKTGSGVYFTNVIEGLEKYKHEQAALYGTAPEYNFNILDTVYEVDPTAFITIQDVHDVFGGRFTKGGH